MDWGGQKEGGGGKQEGRSEGKLWSACQIYEKIINFILSQHSS